MVVGSERRVLVKLTEGVSHAGLRSEGDYPLHSILYASVALAQNIAIWLLAVLGAGPGGRSRDVLGPTGRTSVLHPSTLHRHPWLKFGVRHARASELRRSVRPVTANLSMPLAQALSVQGNVLLIGATTDRCLATFGHIAHPTRVVLQGVRVSDQGRGARIGICVGDQPTDNSLRDFSSDTLRAGFWLTGAVIPSASCSSAIPSFASGRMGESE